MEISKCVERLLVPKKPHTVGFDPNLWGPAMWALIVDGAQGVVIVRELDELLKRSETTSDLITALSDVVHARLKLYLAFLTLLTRILPCEPCRRSFTLLFRGMTETVRVLGADIDARFRSALDDAEDVSLEEAGTLASEVLTNIRVLMNDFAYNAQSLVTAKIAGERGDVLDTYIMRRYPSRVQALRKAIEFDSSIANNTAIADVFCMVAMQIHNKHMMEGYLRYVCFLRWLHIVHVLLRDNLERAPLMDAVRRALDEHREAETCTKYTDDHDAATCAQAVAHTIWTHYRHNCGDMEVESPEARTDRLERMRGRAVNWIAGFLNTSEAKESLARVTSTQVND